MKRLWMVLLVCLVPPGVHVGSYYIFVEPAPMRWMTGQGPWPRVPHYRLGAWTAGIYAPILRLDRRLFPSRWLFTERDAESYIRAHGTPKSQLYSALDREQPFQLVPRAASLAAAPGQ